METLAETAPATSRRFAALAGTATVQTLSEIEASARKTVDRHRRVRPGTRWRTGCRRCCPDRRRPGYCLRAPCCCRPLTTLSESSHVLYVSGEESGQQIALRARRLALDTRRLKLLAEINLEKILATLQAEKPQVAVIDSVQTLWSEQLSSAPGSVAQVRECAAQPDSPGQAERRDGDPGRALQYLVC